MRFSYCLTRSVFVLSLAAAMATRAQDGAVRQIAEARVVSLRAAIKELEGMFADEYPTQAMVSRLEVVLAADDSAALDALEREALVANNPLLTRHPILFVTRKQYRPDHHNTATLFQPGEINAGSYDTAGALKILNVADGSVRGLLNPGPGVTVRDPEVSYDGKLIVFSMRKDRKDSYHLYTIRSDGTELRQMTSAPGVSDIDPVWLPDGGIVFSSSREPKYCMCNRHIMANLYRMESDGANIHQVGKSTLFEGHASLMPDGRILYDRWEYIDRNFGDAQGLWVCNPDGTGHALYWGNNTHSPGGVINARPLSQTHLVIAVLAACHDRPWGALGLLDRSKGVEGPEPVLRTWPGDFITKISTTRHGWDSTVRLPVKYQDPWPLTDRHFLCARTTGRGEETGIYYLDMHGHEVLVHAEAPGCFDPMPLAPRPRPPMIPTRRNYDHPHSPGTFYVQNAYIGTHMKGVEPGAIKYLRVVESPEKRSWTGGQWGGQGSQSPAMNWHNFENKRILGTVPVEEDGSAYFEVPANTFVFFQALDAKGMMIQSMRSGTYVQPGETYGCIGCHESRVDSVPPPGRRPLAVRRRPDKMNGWNGPPRRFSFQAEVQPVLDRNCISCHDYGKPAAKKLNLAGDRDVVFNTSYVDLWSQGGIKCVGGGPAEIQPAYSWGSHVSPLIQVLLAGHSDVVLTEEEMSRLITWVDLNAPYYPFYESAYDGYPAGRSPLTAGEIGRLEHLTGVKIHFAHNARQRAQVSFARPEASRILSALAADSPERSEALDLIRVGARRLQELPRADMEDFVPGQTDLAREAKYQERLRQEQRVYEAIRAGKKIYDP